MAHSYAVIFNGLQQSRHATKADALDHAYKLINTVQHRNAKLGHAGFPECVEAASHLSKLMGVLATLIPDARKSRCVGRYVLNVVEAGNSLTVRRDTY